MSHDDRNQAGGHPIRHPHLLDCMCCPRLTKQNTRPARGEVRLRAIDEELGVRRFIDMRDAHVEYEGPEVFHDGGHIFEGERCIYCHTNVYDIGLYPDAPAICPVPREPLNYSTETGHGASSTDPRLLEPEEWLHDADW